MRLVKSGSAFWFFGGCVVALLASVVGWLGGRQSAAGGNGSSFAPVVLNADSAAGGKSVSVASATVGPDYDGMYMLDHKTGNLYCILTNPRNGAEIAIFQNNVFAGLQLANVADTDLVMCPSFVRLTEGGRTGNATPANSICYVVDGVSGRAVGYTFQFNRQSVEQGVPQAGQLIQVWAGAIRPGVVPAPVPPNAPGANAGGNNAPGANQGGGNN